MGKKAQKKAKLQDVISIIFIFLLILFWTLICILHNKNAYSYDNVISNRGNANISLGFISILFSLINPFIIYSSILNKKKEKTEQSKTATVRRKKQPVHTQELKIFAMCYFIITTIIFLFGTTNMLFSRHTLTKNSIITYNFLNKPVQEYKLNQNFNYEFKVTAERRYKSIKSHGVLYLYLYGQKNFHFKINYSKLSNLSFLKTIKDNYGAGYDKEKIDLFKYYSKFGTWPQEKQKLFNEIFEEE